jgi:hypothetical protein
MRIPRCLPQGISTHSGRPVPARLRWATSSAPHRIRGGTSARVSAPQITGVEGGAGEGRTGPSVSLLITRPFSWGRSPAWRWQAPACPAQPMGMALRGGSRFNSIMGARGRESEAVTRLANTPPGGGLRGTQFAPIPRRWFSGRPEDLPGATIPFRLQAPGPMRQCSATDVTAVSSPLGMASRHWRRRLQLASRMFKREKQADSPAPAPPGIRPGEISAGVRARQFGGGGGVGGARSSWGCGSRLARRW